MWISCLHHGGPCVCSEHRSAAHVARKACGNTRSLLARRRRGISIAIGLSLAAPHQAFAIYMGVRTARLLRQKLLGAGAPAALPIVVVENGTRANELANFDDARGPPRCDRRFRHQWDPRSSLRASLVRCQSHNAGQGACLFPHPPIVRARARTLRPRLTHFEERDLVALPSLCPRMRRSALKTWRSSISSSSARRRCSAVGCRAFSRGSMPRMVARVPSPLCKRFPVQRPRVPLTILYGSESGNAEALAYKAKKTAAKLNCDAKSSTWATQTWRR